MAAQQPVRRNCQFSGSSWGYRWHPHTDYCSKREYEQEYVNRKKYHSINIQLVFDAQYRILDVVAQWPGSVHDSRIWNECGLKADFERGTIPGGCHLIGDSGYPCQPWLLTPILQPRDAAEEAYNRAHKRTRCIVERGIGQLKRRFHVLHGEIRVDPIKTSKIVMVCAALHNLCKEMNLQLPDDEHDEYEDQPLEANPVQPLQLGHLQNGVLVRDHFINLHFRHEQ
ncbi:putative nuclease HARBI1 [Portunus trituberculatus]|uniref:putative nuclease HARBI1 n=1 Tax=Portunus trituberculatus TaxID=210409 RepID=UPI001E1D10A6|nr:putative nuclease HARBI1 [Portunus trituberculatus]